MIHVPYLYIDYKERTRDEILRDDLTALTTVTFKTEYIMDEDSYRGAQKATLIIAIIILCLTWILNTYCRYCARPTLGGNAGGADGNELCFRFIQSLFKVADLYSTIFFWFLIYQTGTWFVFFKLQERVYCFLPDLNNIFPYKDFTWIFGWVVGAKFITCMYKIYFE